MDSLPDYSSLGLPTERDGLEQFDHLQAYRRLGPIYQLQFRGERHVVIAGLEANEAAWRNPDQWSYHEAPVPFRHTMGPSPVTPLDRDPQRTTRPNLPNWFSQSPAHSPLPGNPPVPSVLIGSA